MEPMTSFFEPLQPRMHACDSHTKNASKKTTIPILSLYGGGTRGEIPLRVLKEVTKRTGMEPAEAFKILSGTSIGGIEVGVLNIKNKEDPTKPAFKVDEFDNFFEQDARSIFPTYSGWNAYRWVYPGYDRKGLHEVLFKYAGDALVSEGIREIVIPAVCDEYRSTWYFTRDKILSLDPERNLFKHHKADVMKEIKLIDVLEATSAAPTYFEKKEIVIDQKPFNFRDGGITTNNPGLAAYSYAYNQNGASADYLMCAIGTGRPKTLSQSYFQNVSYLYWGKDFANYSIEATQESTNVLLSQLLPGQGDDQKFFAFQTEIAEADNSVDDTSEAHFERLRENVKAMLEENEESIDRLCKKLESIANTEV